MYRTRRPIGIVLVGFALLLSAAPAMAAEPPADVVFDGTVTVIFTDLNVGALPDADVTLIARRPDLGEDDVIQELAGTTDADGVAVFSGVARPDDGAPPVTLDARAHLERPNECGGGTVVFDGTASAPAALEVTIPIEVDSAMSACFAVPVRGTVLDSDGEPFAVATAIASVIEPSGSIEEPEVTVDGDGAFGFMVDGWLEGTLVVELTVTGEPMTVDDPQTGCKQLVELVATATWELPGPTQAPEPRALVAEPVVLSEACGSQGTPEPPAAPTITLPPTDTFIAPDDPQAGEGLAAGLFLLLVTALAATIAAERRVSRRGS
jgi:hypothetical protein